MSKFFNFTDFIEQCNSADQADHIANAANAKLERESKVVYSYRPDLTWFTNQTSGSKECTYCGGDEIECCRFYKIDPVDTHKALLINIETIEKCTHPEEKIRKQEWPYGLCECGIRVKPAKFEPV